MAHIRKKIELYLEANSKSWDRTKIELQDNSDGNGAFITSWSYDISEPTAEQLASYETEATKIENNNAVISTRKTAYGSWESQLEEIYDNGIDAWKARITQIKIDNPKN